MDATPTSGPARWPRAVWLLFAVAVPACSIPRSPTMASVPPEWRHGNPFGPEANAARARGELGVHGTIHRAAEWEALAREHIQTGDILFRCGQSLTLSGNLTSYFLASLNDGRFSHEGFAHWEGDHLWVFDVETEGVRSVPFEQWMLDTRGNAFAVKRLRPEYRHCIPQAVAYCQSAYERRLGFDFHFDPSDEAYYCSELVEKAYRSAGVALSDPLPIRRMPGYSRFWLLTPIVEWQFEIDPETAVFAPGNEHYGTFSSPLLETAYEGPEEEPWARGGPTDE